MAHNTSLSDTEIKIICFLLEHNNQFAIREISRRTKIDYKQVYTSIKKLVIKKSLIKKRQANIDLCSLNLNADFTSIYYVEMLRTQRFLEKHPDLKRVFNSVSEKIKNIYYSVIVFGSFAKGTEKKNSDIDILIIAQAKIIGEEIERIIINESIFLTQKIQCLVLGEKEFIENLASKKVNVVKEVFMNHIIIAGMEGFYNGIRQTL